MIQNEIIEVIFLSLNKWKQLTVSNGQPTEKTQFITSIPQLVNALSAAKIMKFASFDPLWFIFRFKIK